MATLMLGPGLSYDFAWQDIFGAAAWDYALISKTGTVLAVQSDDVNDIDQDFIILIEGTGFTYGQQEGYGDQDSPTGGTVTKITVYVDGNNDQVVNDGEPFALAFSGLNIRLDQLAYTMFGYATPIFSRTDDPWAAVSLLLSGNDTIQLNELANNFRLTVGENRGNDRFLGSARDEFFDGNIGKDLYDGKGGTDTLSFIWRSIDDENASRGIVLDAIGKKVKALGTVTDPWGGKDTFKSIEKFEGTLNNDVMRGANQSTYTEWFQGFDGNDTIDGRKGFDAVTYETDLQFPGGLRGITAVLKDKGFGTIVDAFGARDKVVNVEMIVGTVFDDVMVGNKFANTFAGLVGNDTIDGKGGIDTIDYSRNDYYKDKGVSGDGGITVDLAVTDGSGYSDIADGLGGTDHVRNVENVTGTSFADSIFGNASANVLRGGAGADQLGGGLGNDTLYGGMNEDGTDGDGAADWFRFATTLGPNNVDTIREFEVGTDVIYIYNNGAFPAYLDAGDGYLDPGEFVSGAGVTEGDGPGVHFAYDTTTGNLYYDDDATVPGSILFARIFNSQGLPSALSASDIFIGD